jgi:hypothetical protein
MQDNPLRRVFCSIGKGRAEWQGLETSITATKSLCNPQKSWGGKGGRGGKGFFESENFCTRKFSGWVLSVKIIATIKLQNFLHIPFHPFHPCQNRKIIDKSNLYAGKGGGNQGGSTLASPCQPGNRNWSKSHGDAPVRPRFRWFQLAAVRLVSAAKAQVAPWEPTQRLDQPRRDGLKRPGRVRTPAVESVRDGAAAALERSGAATKFPLMGKSTQAGARADRLRRPVPIR